MRKQMNEALQQEGGDVLWHTPKLVDRLNYKPKVKTTEG